jgi:hypothetical protein
LCFIPYPENYAIKKTIKHLFHPEPTFRTAKNLVYHVKAKKRHFNHKTAKANIKGKTEGNDKKTKIVTFYLYKNPKSRTL